MALYRSQQGRRQGVCLGRAKCLATDAPGLRHNFFRLQPPPQKKKKKKKKTYIYIYISHNGVGLSSSWTWLTGELTSKNKKQKTNNNNNKTWEAIAPPPPTPGRRAWTPTRHHPSHYVVHYLFNTRHLEQRSFNSRARN